MKIRNSMAAILVGTALALSPLAANTEEATPVKSPLSYTVKDIDGLDVPLSKYAGKVLLIVNVASKCGLTKQYEGLQALQDKYGEKGLVVLGFPANNFMSQEPGTNEEIKFFCTSKYNVTFPMFSKISVKGDDIAPLYKFLTEEGNDGQFTGDVNWNFEKFLVGTDGKVAARFAPKTTPDSEEVIAAIETALGIGRPEGAPAS